MKVIKSERGFGLIEVIIVAAIVSIIALGIGTMISDMFSAQQKTSQVGSLNSIRARIIETLNSPAHWTATINDASNDAFLDCLRAATANCATGFSSVFNIVQAGPVSIYPAATATAGFRFDGQPCNTFSTATPDPTCPFRWNVTWEATCTGSANCKTPDVRIRGDFVYAAGPKVTVGGGFNPTTYSFDFRRGALAIRNETIVIRHIAFGATAAAVEEVGACFDGTNPVWHTRQLSELIDTAVVGATLDAANDTFTLPAGAYNCRAGAPGFKNGGNRIRLCDTAGAGCGVINAQSGISLASVSGGGSVVSVVDVSFRTNAAVTLRVQHMCTDRPSSSPFGSTNNNWMLGVPVPDGGGTYGTSVANGSIFTRIICTRTGS
jgi:prepilin-type N-terminal cleavage/methylation domain-containing protein